VSGKYFYNSLTAAIWKSTPVGSVVATTFPSSVSSSKKHSQKANHLRLSFYPEELKIRRVQGAQTSSHQITWQKWLGTGLENSITNPMV